MNGTDREAFQCGDWLVAHASVNIGSPRLLRDPQLRTVMQLLQVAVANEPLDLVHKLHEKKKKKPLKLTIVSHLQLHDNRQYRVTNKTLSLNPLS